ncbi:site-specific integrase [uncultured Thiocystis sp.]|jgi:integrase|uniref:tyrosine-type recombinase/integrase n=1 Tax=uncultured Thiocystis sp. TaxID=1202134 RepID=UPI0025CCA0E8|nr:site-specific integrase [uncultured Thiocystis sp.]
MQRKRQNTDQDGLYERHDSPYYWASFVDASGKRVRRSTGIRRSIEGRREADALLAKWKLEAHRQRQWDELPTHSFDDLMLEYLKATAGERRSESTVHMHVRRLRLSFAGATIEQLRAAEITVYIRRRKGEGVSNSTINRELEVLSAAIAYAVREWEWPITNPVPGRMLKEPEGRLRWITRDEATNLIGAAKAQPKAPHLAPLIVLALHTGMRRGELLGLEWNRVDLNEGLIYLEARHTKAAKRRAVPVNAVAREALLNRAHWREEQCPTTSWVFSDLDGSRIGSVKRSFATACRNAGIADFRFHDLRHTCAAWLVQLGVPLMDVRDVLGHSTVKMTERYAHLSPAQTRAAVSVLEAGESRLSHVEVGEGG